MVGLARGPWGSSDNAQCQHRVLQPTAPQPREHRIGMDLMHRFLFREPTHPRQEALSTQLLRRELQCLSWCPNTLADTALDTS